MDRNKIDQQLDRRMEKMDLANAIASGREPLTDYGRMSFKARIFYEDAELSVKVLKCKDRINDTFHGIRCEGYGPWILFTIIDIEAGDLNALLCPGAAVMARWDNSKKIYRKYIYKEDPEAYDKEVLAMSALMKISEIDIAEGK